MPFAEALFLKGEVKIDLGRLKIIKRIKTITIRDNYKETSEVNERNETKKIEAITYNEDGSTTFNFYGTLKDVEELENKIKKKTSELKKDFWWLNLKESEEF